MATVNESARQSAKDKNPSASQHQSANTESDVEPISIADGFTKFYENRCEFYESAFFSIDRQAAKDVMGKFLKYDKQNREQIGGAFFENLSTKRQALMFGLSPSLFLPEVADADAELDALCDRNDELIELEKHRELTDGERTELAQLQAKLSELGLI